MRIHAATAGGVARTQVQAFDGSTPVPVALAPPGAASTDGSEIFLPLLGKGTLLGGVYSGGTYLISRVNDATPLQIAAQLQKYNIVRDPGMAKSQAKQLLDIAQSKGSNSLMLGVVAGAWVGVGVHLLRPRWPLWSKLVMGAVTAAIVAAGLYLGFDDRPTDRIVAMTPSSQ